jgi:hypothetical protein
MNFTILCNIPYGRGGERKVFSLYESVKRTGDEKLEKRHIPHLESHLRFGKDEKDILQLPRNRIPQVDPDQCHRPGALNVETATGGIALVNI